MINLFFYFSLTRDFRLLKTPDQNYSIRSVSQATVGALALEPSLKPTLILAFAPLLTVSKYFVQVLPLPLAAAVENFFISDQAPALLSKSWAE